MKTEVECVVIDSDDDEDDIEEFSDILPIFRILSHFLELALLWLAVFFE